MRRIGTVNSMILEARVIEVEDLMDILTFLYPTSPPTAADEECVRAMIVLGGARDLIVRAYAIAATNSRVPRSDKSRYAMGVLKNLMLEDEA